MALFALPAVNAGDSLMVEQGLVMMLDFNSWDVAMTSHSELPSLPMDMWWGIC